MRRLLTFTVPFCRYAAIGVLKIVLSSCLSPNIEAWRDLDPEQPDQQHLRRENEENDPHPEHEGIETTADDLTPEISSSPELAPLLQSANPSSADQYATQEARKRPSAGSKFYQSLSQGLLNSVFTLDQDEKIILFKLCALMATDSCAVGMSSVSWQTYFVRINFNVLDGSLGLIFFTANMLGACGTVSSNALARRMGNLVVCSLHFFDLRPAFESFSDISWHKETS